MTAPIQQSCNLTNCGGRCGICAPSSEHEQKGKLDIVYDLEDCRSLALAYAADATTDAESGRHYAEVANDLGRHIDALTALEKAVTGCGKSMYSEPVVPCGALSEDGPELCDACSRAIWPAIRSLLRRET